MNCLMTMYEEDRIQAAATMTVKRRPLRKPLALLVTLVCSVLPALAVAASNGSLDDPLPRSALRGLSPDVQLPEAPLDRFTIEEVVVTAPAPKKMAHRGPRTCKTRDLELYGSQVRVCGRPASPAGPRRTPERRSSSDLAGFYR